MGETIFVKLGGSVITNKRERATLRRESVVRLGEEISAALAERPISLLLGHGAGSFGHFPAAEHRVKDGLAGGGGWEGYWETRREVVRLNWLVMEALAEGGARVFPVQPSASAVARDGRLERMDAQVIEQLLAHGQTPMIFGDAVLDEERGFTIVSTEDIFEFLAPRLAPAAMIFACDVDGVFTDDPSRNSAARLLRRINASAGPGESASLGGSAGIDVTGGMEQKVKKLCAMARAIPCLRIQIINGSVPNALRAAMLGHFRGGTEIVASDDAEKIRDLGSSS